VRSGADDDADADEHPDDAPAHVPPAVRRAKRESPPPRPPAAPRTYAVFPAAPALLPGALSPSVAPPEARVRRLAFPYPGLDVYSDGPGTWDPRALALAMPRGPHAHAHMHAQRCGLPGSDVASPISAYSGGSGGGGGGPGELVLPPLSVPPLSFETGAGSPVYAPAGALSSGPLTSPLSPGLGSLLSPAGGALAPFGPGAGMYAYALGMPLPTPTPEPVEPPLGARPVTLLARWHMCAACARISGFFPPQRAHPSVYRCWCICLPCALHPLFLAEICT
jgi:hypothetical protein